MNDTKIFIILASMFSLAISVIVYFFAPSYHITGFEKALDGILLFSSITLGFYGACLSVLASIFNTRAVKEIMEDNTYRRDFVSISAVNLISGFLTVVITIVYQVMLANKRIPEATLRVTNSIWSGMCVLYVSLTVLFVVVTFMIFLNNQEVKTQKVHSGEVGKTDF